MTEPRSIDEVVSKQLCTGCGVCAYLAPERFRMVDALALGRRPYPVDGAGDGTSTGADARDAEAQALDACPGPRLEHTFDPGDPEILTDLAPGWGPVYEVWEGHAADPEIRRAGSSGGAVTALSLWAIERGGMHGVLHVAAREDRPFLNETVLSTGRDDLLARTGSRYAPASPCDGLDRIEAAPAPCVFVGKPCDVAATRRARELRPELDRNLGLLLAFFCAGTPSGQGNLELLRKAGVEDPRTIESLRYRGNGWPGHWTVTFRDGTGELVERAMTYQESWGFLQRYRQWRCYICPDHSGELADIALGDPWYREIEPGEDGTSLLVVRTKRGREILHAAAADGYLVLERMEPSLLPRSQPNLIKARGALWSRLLALRLAGVTIPRYIGFPTFRFWLRELGLRRKLGELWGTLRRVGKKGLRKPVRVEPASDEDFGPR